MRFLVEIDWQLPRGGDAELAGRSVVEGGCAEIVATASAEECPPGVGRYSVTAARRMAICSRRVWRCAARAASATARAWAARSAVKEMERSSSHRLASVRMCGVDRTRAVEILGRFHAAQSAFYIGGDADAVRVLLTEDVAWHVPGRNAIAGDYRGTDAVLAYFTRRRELAERTFRMHPRDVLVGEGDEVAVVTDGTAVIGGVERGWSTVGLYRIREERVAACWLLPLDGDAFDAICAAP